jgi:hypothetical protein
VPGIIGKKRKIHASYFILLAFLLDKCQVSLEKKRKTCDSYIIFLAFLLDKCHVSLKKKKNHGDVSKDRMPKLAEALGSRPSLMLNFVGIFVVYLDSIGDDTKHILSFIFVERVLKMECPHINFFSH